MRPKKRSEKIKVKEKQSDQENKMKPQVYGWSIKLVP